MSSPTQAPPTANGGWDVQWSSLERGMTSLFTRGRLKTIHQFWQRCYAEDLWTIMGSKAANAEYVELGAGRGTTSMYLTSKGCKVTMLDLSAAGFRVAEANFAREGLKLPTMIKADARNTPLPSESFDCVVSIGLLEHFDNPRPVLVEALRLLRPGGLHFALVIPQGTEHAHWLVYALLRPWSWLWSMLPMSFKALVKPGRYSSNPVTEDVPRTNYVAADYLNMLYGLPVTDASCTPYNPYHPVYNTPFVEANLTIPLYQLHRRIHRLFALRPWMVTYSGLASCLLLTFRKAAEDL